MGSHEADRVSLERGPVVVGSILPVLLNVLAATVVLVVAALFVQQFTRYGGELKLVGLLIMFPAILLLMLIGPSILALLIALPPALWWKRPSRILVARRFHQGRSTGALRAMLGKIAAPWGHVYTLADEDITVPWLLRYPVLLGQFAYFHFRDRAIRSDRELARFLASVRVRWARNLNWMVSLRKTFPVRCSDELWQRCFSGLATLSDVILVELSAPSASLQWEIDFCRRERLLGRVILLAPSDREVAVQSLLQASGIAAEGVRRVLYATDEYGDLLEHQLREVLENREPSRSDVGSAVTAAAKPRVVRRMLGLWWILLALALVWLILI